MGAPGVRPADDQAAANRRGVIAIIGAMTVFLVSDVLVKMASDTVGTPELMVVRGLAAVITTIVMLFATGQYRRMRFALTPLIFVRSLLDGGATWGFLAAIAEIPLANANTIAMATPLVMMPIAVLYLRERVTPRQWLMTIIGFCGVLLVLQPQEDWQPGSLYAVACMGFMAVREIVTRRLPLGAPTLGVTLLSALAITFIGGAGVVQTGWRAMEWSPFWLIVVAGVLNAWGNYLNTTAFRVGMVSVVAPFRYATIPLSFAAGYLFWGTIPTPLMLFGAVLILVAGLILLRGSGAPPRSSDDG